MNIADTLRREIGRADSIKKVSVEAGVPYASVYEFYHRSLNIQLLSVQRLADYFGYRLVKSRPRRTKKRG